jgi:deoxyribonuclease V
VNTTLPRDVVGGWPTDADELVEVQRELAQEHPAPWHPGGSPRVGGCFAVFPEDGSAVAAAVVGGDTATAIGEARAPYMPGLLALRAGPVLEAAVRALPEPPDVLIVDATGRDHPRRAGLAVQLGQVLDLPTIGVTHRTLLAGGEWPAPERGAHSPLEIDGEEVGAWLRIMPRARPIAVHAGWRTDPETAVEVVMAIARKVRTPEPLRAARKAARIARAATTLNGG